jgi:hypothetical protein
MSLNNLKISGILVKELYQNQLVTTGGKDASTSTGTMDTLPVEKAPEVAVILFEEQPGAVSERSYNMLSKILAACRWQMANTNLINLNGNPQTWNEIRKGGVPRICLLFGNEAMAIDLPVIFPEFRIQQFDHTRFLFTPALAQIEKDTLLKSKLWLCMKELFNV